ncbi:MAG: hypothetical protein ACXAAH_11900 [Promethearchaeota archaeon]|jgi:hypothetical protein
MNANLKYHEILEEDVAVEMEWVKEEFEILFKSKAENYSPKDKKIANDLLNYILENTDVHENIGLHNIVGEATNSIEKSYPTLFN